jgi:hypothetical protein
MIQDSVPTAPALPFVDEIQPNTFDRFSASCTPFSLKDQVSTKPGQLHTFHHVSKKHLGRYCDEFSFRWNTRDVSDGERMKAAIRGANGKRLTYHPIS